MDATEYHLYVLLRPLDILLVLKLSASPDAAQSYAGLAKALGVSPSQAHSAARRAREAWLLNESLEVRRRAALDMLVPGIKYYLATREGAESRGMPTSYGASPIKELFGDHERVPVWPMAEGGARGPSVEPIYETAPFAAKLDEGLYRLLVAVDAIRIGRAREVAAGREALERFYGATV